MSERDDFQEELNRTLDDVIDLLEREIERLQESLATYRLTNHPNRRDLIRWHVRSLDERQDALENLHALIAAERESASVH